MLVAQGVPHNDAIDRVIKTIELERIAVSEMAGPSQSQQADAGLKKMGWGCLWFIAGVIITVASYSVAGPGETYTLFYGPIVYGLFSIISGLISWLRNS